MPKKTQREIVLTFKRHSIADLPDKLNAYAARQVDQKLRNAIQSCAAIITGWLGTPGDIIRCSRSEDSWQRVLVPWARASGAHTAATLIEAKLALLAIEEENAAEKRDFDKRTALAMAEYRAGGGE